MFIPPRAFGSSARRLMVFFFITKGVMIKMGYYAYSDGEVCLKKSPEEILEELKEKYSEAKNCIDLDTFIRDKFNVNVTDMFFSKVEKKYIMSFYNDEKYDEDSYIEMLEGLADYIVQPASIKFRGEDDSFWKLTLKDNTITSCSGSVVYEDELPTYFNGDIIEKIIETEHFKKYIGEYNNSTDVYEALNEELSKSEEYWTNDKIRQLIFAITLCNYAWKNEDNYDGNEKLEVYYSETSDYLNSVIDSQTI